MDNIAQALGFAFQEEFSNQSEATGNIYQEFHQDNFSAFASHNQVVDVLVQGEESNHSDLELFSYSQSADQDYDYSVSSSEDQPVWIPQYQPVNYLNAQSFNEHQADNKKILLQRNHTRRSRDGRTAAKRFEDAGKREEYRRAACERERARMKDCNKIFAQLRAGLPTTKSSGKRVSKIETLRTAIKYIKHLQYLLSFPPGHHLPQNVVQFNPFGEMMY